MIKVVVLDFDDTLVQSEHIKLNGFVDIFSSIKGSEEIAKNYVDRNFGDSRYEMIEGILNGLKEDKLVDFEVSEEIIKEYVRKFGELVEEKIIKENEIMDATAIIEGLSKKYFLYLNSNTPQVSIENIIQQRGWEVFFKGIFGSPPRTKVDNLKKIIEQAMVSPQEVVVIGDGDSDQTSAKIVGASFIGIRSDYNNWRIAEREFTVLDNLADIPKFISLI
ncbi:MAG: HAD hydrolase-like protein [Patescibacteria group bacterium]